MKKSLLPLIVMLLVTTTVFSQVLYSSTAYTSRFNPGIGSTGAPVVAYDDVNIPSAIAADGDSISITKINVGIRRVPNAPATNVSLYYTTFQIDSADGKTVKKSEQLFLGKVSLPVNGGSLVTSVISLGDSVAALFKVKADANIGNGYQKFLLGASFDNPSPGNGIILTKDTNNNEDAIWIDNSNNEKNMYATSFNSRMPASYYLQVFGGAAKQMTENRSTNSDMAVHKVVEVNTGR